MIFSAGLNFPEGPVVLPDGSWLVVEMAQPGSVTHISPDGRDKQVIARTGRPNGLAVDKNGHIWVAESAQSALLRMTLEGKTEVVASACDGQPFLWPNDLCFGPDGAIYMTDSGIRVCDYKVGDAPRPNFEQIPLDGRVFRIDPATSEVRKLDGGFRFTNGIAFGPDSKLYVNETRTGMVYRYAWRDGGEVGPRECFGQSNPDPVPGYQGPDGMAFSQDGQVVCGNFRPRPREHYGFKRSSGRADPHPRPETNQCCLRFAGGQKNLRHR